MNRCFLQGPNFQQIERDFLSGNFLLSEFLLKLKESFIALEQVLVRCQQFDSANGWVGCQSQVTLTNGSDDLEKQCRDQSTLGWSHSSCFPLPNLDSVYTNQFTNLAHGKIELLSQLSEPIIWSAGCFSKEVWSGHLKEVSTLRSVFNFLHGQRLVEGGWGAQNWVSAVCSTFGSHSRRDFLKVNSQKLVLRFSLSWKLFDFNY